MLNRLRHHPLNRLRAFTLVEMALVLGLSAMIAGMVIKASAPDPNLCVTQTQGQLKDIEAAITRYVAKNERYPVPAKRELGVDDLGYGREAPLNELDSQNNVTFGSLPFQALGLPSTYASDCWSNKFTYSVTTALTNTTEFKKNGTNYVQGKITLKSSSNVTTNSNISYAVISHGADGFGAVTSNYRSSAGSNANPRKWCDASNDLQNLNCSRSATIAATTAADGSTANSRFDDLVIFEGRNLTPINGSIRPGAPGQCLTGTIDPSFSYNGACNVTQTWTCLGINGGTNATGSSYNGQCSCTTPPATNWGAGCTTNYTGGTIAHGASTSALLNNNASYTADSSIQYQCNNGSWSVTSQSCNPRPVCNNNAINTCIVGTPSNQSGTTACGTPTPTWSCTSGGVSASCQYTTANATCPPPSCTGLGTVFWGAGCSAHYSGTINAGGNSGPISNTAGGYTGSVTYNCDASGRWTGQIAPSCTPATCAARTVSWGGNCSANLSNANNGGVQTINSTASGFSGSSTWSCNNGSWSGPASQSCTAEPPVAGAHCIKWNYWIGGVSNVALWSRWDANARMYYITRERPGGTGNNGGQVSRAQRDLLQNYVQLPYNYRGNLLRNKDKLTMGYIVPLSECGGYN